MDFDYFHIRDFQREGKIAIGYVDTNPNPADFFTKKLGSTKCDLYIDIISDDASTVPGAEKSLPPSRRCSRSSCSHHPFWLITSPIGCTKAHKKACPSSRLRTSHESRGRTRRHTTLINKYIQDGCEAGHSRWDEFSTKRLHFT